MPTTFFSVVKNIIKIVFPLAFGLLILWLVYRDMDFSSIMEVFKSDVNFWIIGLSLFFGLGANIIRGIRWNILIQALGEKPRVSNLVYAVLGNYVVNLVLPRLGEVWRCGMIAKYEKISFSKLFGTLLIDRFFDTLSVALIVLFSIFLNIPFFTNYIMDNPDLFNKLYIIFTSVWLYLFLVTIIALIWIIFTYFGHLKIIIKTKSFLNNIWIGMKTVWYMKDKWKFLFYTILIWLGYFLFFYICFYAFDFTQNLGWKEGLIAFGLSSLAVAIPVQGAIGPWHAAVIATLVSFGVGNTNAAAWALIVHTIQTLFTALCGLVGVAALPIKNKLQVDELTSRRVNK